MGREQKGGVKGVGEGKEERLLRRLIPQQNTCSFTSFQQPNQATYDASVLVFAPLQDSSQQ